LHDHFIAKQATTAPLDGAHYESRTTEIVVTENGEDKAIVIGAKLEERRQELKVLGIVAAQEKQVGRRFFQGGAQRLQISIDAQMDVGNEVEADGLRQPRAWQFERDSMYRSRDRKVQVNWKHRHSSRWS
jgi:hypothetical protein